MRVCGLTGPIKQQLRKYGHDSAAWAITLTPTYQYKVLFARAPQRHQHRSGAGDAGSRYSVLTAAVFRRRISRRIARCVGFSFEAIETAQTLLEMHNKAAAA